MLRRPQGSRPPPPFVAGRGVLDRIFAFCYKPLDLNRKKYITMMRARLLSALAACLAAAFLTLSSPLRADGLADITALYRQGNYAQALERVNAYLDLRPKDAGGRFLKGLILTEQKNYPEATEVFLSLTEDDPTLPEPYNNLAVLYAAQGKYQMAKMQLEMAIDANPGYATAHENLGDVYARMAGQAYGKALELESSNSSARVKLSLMQEFFAKTGTPGAVPPRDPEAAPRQ